MRLAFLLSIPFALAFALAAPSSALPAFGPAHAQLPFELGLDPSSTNHLLHPYVGWEDPRIRGGAILNVSCCLSGPASGFDCGLPGSRAAGAGKAGG